MNMRLTLVAVALTLLATTAKAQSPWEGAVSFYNHDSRPWTVVVDKDRRYIHVSMRGTARPDRTAFTVQPGQDVAMALDHGDWVIFGDHQNRNSLHVSIHGRRSYNLVLSPYIGRFGNALLGDWHDGYRQISVRLYDNSNAPVPVIQPPPPPYYDGHHYGPPPPSPVPVIGQDQPVPVIGGGPVPVVGGQRPLPVVGQNPGVDPNSPAYEAGYETGEALGDAFANFLDDMLHKN